MLVLIFRYRWNATNPSVAVIGAHSGIATGRAPGHTTVVVVDGTLQEEAGKADVVVSIPARAELLLHRYLPGHAPRPALDSRGAVPAAVRAALAAAPQGLRSLADGDRHDVYDFPFPSCDGKYHLTAGRRYTVKLFLYDAWDRVIDVCNGAVATVTGDSVTIDDASASTDGANHGHHNANGDSSAAAEGAGAAGVFAVGSWITLAASPTVTGESTVTVRLSSMTSAETGVRYVLDTPITAAITVVVSRPVEASVQAILIPTPAYRPRSLPPLSSSSSSSSSSASTAGESYSDLEPEAEAEVAADRSARLDLPAAWFDLSVGGGDGSGGAGGGLGDQCAQDVYMRHGSGSYLFHSSRPGMLAVAGRGALAKVLAVGPAGAAQVLVRDRCNPDQSLTLAAEASPVGQVCPIADAVEVTVGAGRTVGFHVKDVRGRAFTDCGCLRLAARVTEGAEALALASSQDDIPCSRDCTYDTTANADVDANSTSTKTASAAAAGTCNCFKLATKALSPGFSRISAAAFPAGAPPPALDSASASAAALLLPSATEAAASANYSRGARGPHRGYQPRASLVLSVYAPVRPAHAAVAAAVGTVVRLPWTAGPLPWPCALGGFQGQAGGFGTCDVDPRTGLLAAPPVVSHAATGSVTERTGALLYLPSAGASALRTSATLNAADGGDVGVVTIARPASDDATTAAISAELIAIAAAAGDDASAAPAFLPGHYFDVTCLAQTAAPVSAEIRVANAPCASNPSPAQSTAAVSVSCYPAVCAARRSVTLGVGATVPVALAGFDPALGQPAHPLAAQLRYTVDDESVASVSATGEVTGRALGVTLLHVRYPHPSLETAGWGQDGLHDIVVLHVVFTGFDLLASATLLDGEESVASVAGANGAPADATVGDTVEVEWVLAPYTEGSNSANSASAESAESGNGGASAAVTGGATLPMRSSLSLQPLTSFPASLSAPSLASMLSAPALDQLYAHNGWHVPLPPSGPGAGAGAHGKSVRGGAHGSNNGTASVVSLVTHGASVRLLASGAPGKFVLQARVRVRYPGPSAAALATVAAPSGRLSQCAPTPLPAAEGAVAEYTVSKVVTVAPKLALLSTASVLLPPGAATQVVTTIDASSALNIAYSLFTPSGNAASANSGVVNVGSRGWVSAPTNATSHDATILITAAPSVSAHAHSSSNGADSAAGVDSVAELTQTVSVLVSVRPPRSIDAISTLLTPESGASAYSYAHSANGGLGADAAAVARAQNGGRDAAAVEAADRRAQLLASLAAVLGPAGHSGANNNANPAVSVTAGGAGDKPEAASAAATAAAVAASAAATANTAAAGTVATHDPTRRARVLFAHDGSAASAAPEPLCPPASSAAWQRAARFADLLGPAAAAAGWREATFSAPPRPAASNVSVHVVSRDGRGHIFDSVALLQRDGAVHVHVDKPELVSVAGAALSSSFSLQGSSVALNATSRTPVPLLPAILATLDIAATGFAPAGPAAEGERASVDVTVTVTVTHPAWEPMPPLRLRLRVGTRYEHQQ